MFSDLQQAALTMTWCRQRNHSRNKIMPCEHVVPHDMQPEIWEGRAAQDGPTLSMESQ